MSESSTGVSTPPDLALDVPTRGARPMRPVDRSAAPRVASTESAGSDAGAAGRWSRRASALVAACLTVFVALALALAFTRPPQSDEGHFASAGASLAFGGRLAFPMWTAWIPTLDQRLYSNMPLYFVVLAGWFKAFGAGWLAMRTLSVLWGVVLVAGGAGTAWALTRDRRTTLLATLLLALNYDVVNYASARYDIMAAALSLAALAGYLLLRERSLGRALVVANGCLAAACLTHPYALFGMIVHAVFVLVLDVRRIRPRHVALAALPYLVMGACWGLYIAQDPAMFRAQFGANASGRFRDALSPLRAVVTELRERYLVNYAGWRPGAPVAMRAKLGLLLLYVVGVVGTLVLPELRRRRGVVALTAATVTCALVLGVVDSMRWYIYLVHVLPLYVLCLALTAGALLARRGWWAPTVQAGTAAYVLFTLASVAYRARLDVHHRAFLPTARYLERNVREGDVVVAGGQFGMELGFARHVRDDRYFVLPEARSARFIVVDPDYAAAHAVADDATRQRLASALADYALVLRSDQGGVRYDVFARRDAR